MAYSMAGVPAGSYNAGRLVNLGTNHWSLDAGGGYTYLDSKKGHEFSAVLGFTYVNLRGYKEFDAKHRPEGWNLW